METDPPPRRNVTMQEVATAAKVSLMTVSYALRGHSSISSATRERVCQIAADLGYTGNPMVSSLMKQIRWKKNGDAPPGLAFLSAGTSRAAILSDPFRKTCFEGAHHRAQSLGFELQLIPLRSRSAAAAARLGVRLAARNLQGLICDGFAPDPPPPLPDWSPFASCVIGPSHACSPHHQVGSNDAAMVLLAIERLKSLGYNRIGFLGGASGDGRVEDAVISVLAGYNRSTPRHPVRFLLLSKEEWNTEALTTWVRRHPLDALIIQSPAVEPLISASPLAVPGDLALATLKRTEPSHLAGIDRQPREIGAAAVELIVHELYENRRGLPATRHTFLLDGRWVDGATAPPHGSAPPGPRPRRSARSSA